MAGAAAAELAKRLDVVERNGRPADNLVVGVDRLNGGKVQHRIEQHRCVSGGEHETVAVRPDGIIGIKSEKALPQTIHYRRHSHWSAGMPRVGLLNSIDG